MEEVLHWLKNKKPRAVTEIMEVTVLDRLRSPHDDQVIEDCVKSFRVQILNWRKLDLCLAGFTSEGLGSGECPIETLHLYSSGNQAVIKHWLCREGSGGLLDLPKVSVYCSLPRKRIGAYISYLAENLTRTCCKGKSFYTLRPRVRLTV